MLQSHLLSAVLRKLDLPNKPADWPWTTSEYVAIVYFLTSRDKRVMARKKVEHLLAQLRNLKRCVVRNQDHSSSRQLDAIERTFPFFGWKPSQAIATALTWYQTPHASKRQARRRIKCSLQIENAQCWPTHWTPGNEQLLMALHRFGWNPEYEIGDWNSRTFPLTLKRRFEDLKARVDSDPPFSIPYPLMNVSKSTIEEWLSYQRNPPPPGADLTPWKKVIIVNAWTGVTLADAHLQGDGINTDHDTDIGQRGVPQMASQQQTVQQQVVQPDIRRSQRVRPMCGDVNGGTTLSVHGLGGDSEDESTVHYFGDQCLRTDTSLQSAPPRPCLRPRRPKHCPENQATTNAVSRSRTLSKQRAPRKQPVRISTRTTSTLGRQRQRAAIDAAAVAAPKSNTAPSVKRKARVVRPRRSKRIK